ncbi:MAG: hypothetical protein GX247_04385 [Mollicutes bacterium]|nr:hypothetical protein [Mollicutes bacterium]
MKKLIVILLMTLGLVGCNDSKEQLLIEYQKIMEKYSQDYFERFIKGIRGLDILEVSIGMLENANEVANTNYDLSKLEDCDKSSTIMLFLSNDGLNIKRYHYDLNCKL